MANYTFKLHHRDGVTPFTEDLDVDSDEDAEDLAKVTLLGMAGCTHAEVYLGNRLVAACQRDSSNGGLTQQARELIARGAWRGSGP